MRKAGRPVKASSGDVARNRLLACFRGVLDPLNLNVAEFVEQFEDDLAEYRATMDEASKMQTREADREWLRQLQETLGDLSARLRPNAIPPRADIALFTAVQIGETWSDVVGRLRVDLAAAGRIAVSAESKLRRPSAKAGLLADGKGRPNQLPRDRLLWCTYQRIKPNAKNAEAAREATAELLVLVRPAIDLPRDDRALERAISNGKKA